MWSLLLLKPDLVAHPPLLREAIREILAAGVTVAGARRLQLTAEHTERLYGGHKGKFFYGRLVRHVSSGPVIAMRVRGDVRSLLGSSRLWPLTEAPTLRQRLALSDVRNVAHNSDAESAADELELFEPLPPAEALIEAILAGHEEDGKACNKGLEAYCVLLIFKNDCAWDLLLRERLVLGGTFLKIG